MEQKQTNKIVCLTFDIDCVDHFNNGRFINEFGIIEKLLPVIKDFKIPCTWFLRIDKQIEVLYGNPVQLIIQNNRIVDKLIAMGNDIGWHLHSYKKSDEKWVQNTNEDSVLNEINRYAQKAKSYNMSAFRMGWGYQTNKIMRYLSNENFKIDSSAIPRPKYDWETGLKNWESTPNEPYFPSKNDYRVPGRKRLKILEVPMSVEVINAPYDQQEVKRYINLAYHSNIFREAVERYLRENRVLTIISHPYEFTDIGVHHPLLGFDSEHFINNIKYLCSISDLEFLNLSQLYNYLSKKGL